LGEFVIFPPIRRPSAAQPLRQSPLKTNDNSESDEYAPTAPRDQSTLKTNDNSEDDEYVPPDIDHPPRGAEWEKDPSHGQTDTKTTAF
jgi:hypothetical protein